MDKRQMLERARFLIEGLKSSLPDEDGVKDMRLDADREQVVFDLEGKPSTELSLEDFLKLYS